MGFIPPAFEPEPLPRYNEEEYGEKNGVFLSSTCFTLLSACVFRCISDHIIHRFISTLCIDNNSVFTKYYYIIGFFSFSSGCQTQGLDTELYSQCFLKILR